MSDARRGCEICGDEPTTDAGLDTKLCAAHAARYRARSCPRCGTRVLALEAVGRCDLCLARKVVEELPPGASHDLEKLVRARRWLEAIMSLRTFRPSLGLGEAELVVRGLAEQLGVPQREPDPPLDALLAKVVAIGRPPSAIEAVWDGDTHGWFVVLLALFGSATGPGFTEHHLAFIADEDGDMRLFNGAAPPWPEAKRASELGRALATHFGVPFYFGSPDRPDDRAPRWSPGAG